MSTTAFDDQFRTDEYAPIQTAAVQSFEAIRAREERILKSFGIVPNEVALQVCESWRNLAIPKGDPQESCSEKFDRLYSQPCTEGFATQKVRVTVTMENTFPDIPEHEGRIINSVSVSKVFDTEQEEREYSSRVLDHNPDAEIEVKTIEISWGEK